MSSLLKSLFKKDKSVAETAATQEVSAVEKNSKSDAVNKEATEKKGKHGQPGVCCGSCS
ncbi:CCGSCS motif protein [Neptuniibacter sp. SY11_33]|uniref:CCGSCS motif protein n=1 Tax=Neptuniibacter sp. SY11_33 TaxID=3398215 RepID=UPI0039F5A301